MDAAAIHRIANARRMTALVPAGYCESTDALPVALRGCKCRSWPSCRPLQRKFEIHSATDHGFGKARPWSAAYTYSTFGRYQPPNPSSCISPKRRLHPPPVATLDNECSDNSDYSDDSFSLICDSGDGRRSFPQIYFGLLCISAEICTRSWGRSHGPIPFGV